MVSSRCLGGGYRIPITEKVALGGLRSVTQRCMKCGKRIEPVLEDGISGHMSITVEICLADAYCNKESVLDFRYYCQDCGSLIKTILENWEGD